MAPVMIETEKRKHTNFLLNMKTFHNLKIKTNPPIKPYTPKRVIKKQRTLPVFQGRKINQTKKPRRKVLPSKKKIKQYKHLYINLQVAYNSQRNKNWLY